MSYNVVASRVVPAPTVTLREKMKLVQSTAVAISSTFAVLAVSLFAAFHFSVLEKFREVEQAEVQEDIARAVGALRGAMEELTLKTLDWAQWDATYQFMKDHNREYFQGNLISPTMEAIDTDHIVYLDKEGRIFEAREFLRKERAAVAMNSATAQHIANEPRLQTHTNAASRVSGLMLLGDRVFLVSAVPITDSARSKPLAGTLIFTRQVSPSFLNSIAEQTKLDLTFSVLESGKASPSIAPVLSVLSRGTDVEVVEVDEKTSRGYGVLRDLNGTPVLLLQTAVARDIYQRGLTARNFLALCLALCTIACIAVTLVFLRRRVLNPLSEVGRQMTEIARSNDSSKRIALKGNDELSQLSADINSMLVSLDGSRHALEAARDSAESASRAKSLFVAKVSHELRTPLHTIMGMQTILLNSETSPGKRTHIRIAQEAALSLLACINDILDYSKAESGRLSIEQTDFDPRNAVRDTLRMIAPRFVEQPNVEFICDVSRAVPEKLRSDPFRLRQIILNLLSNAAKFTTHGFVRLSIDFEWEPQKKGNLVLRVIDSGTGISKVNLQHIFEPFCQGDESHTRRSHGTGLGLTIVKQLAEAMGGNVAVVSELGSGSTFTVTIPVDPSHCVTWNFVPLLRCPRTVIVDCESCFKSAFEAMAKQYGVATIKLNPKDPEVAAKLSHYAKEAGLIVLSSEAIQSEQIRQFVYANRALPYLIMIRPSDVSLSFDVEALAISHIVHQPIITDDIFQVASFRLPSFDQSPSEQKFVDFSCEPKLHVLIADDSSANRTILEIMFGEAGHAVTTVDNGRALVEKVRHAVDTHERIDLIITDVQMPEIDGIEAVQQIRRIESQAGCPRKNRIITLSGHVFPEDMQRMVDAGADAVVKKPVEFHELFATVLRLITPSRAPSNEPSHRADTGEA